MAQDCEERGIRLGEERGARLGNQAALLALLRARFGAIPERMLAAVEVAGAEQLQPWVLGAGTGAGLETLMGDRVAHSNGAGPTL
jgi:hypothetical protein